MLVMVLCASITLSSCSKDDDENEDKKSSTNSLVGTLWSDMNDMEEFTVEFNSEKKCIFSLIVKEEGNKKYSYECNYTYSESSNSVSWVWIQEDGDKELFNGTIDGADGIVMHVNNISWYHGNEESYQYVFYKIK